MFRNSLWLLVGLGVLGIPTTSLRAQTASGASDAIENTYQEKIVPRLSQYCTRCHGAEKPKAGLNLAAFADVSAVVKARKTWENVLDHLQAGDMPPPKEPRPGKDDIDLITGWIEATLSTFDCKLPSDPGQVTLRRLNRAEYNNTIRDLIGIDFRPADDFPSDDVGYGFDNIGDVLTTSPILMERYLAAAEEIAERAIMADRENKGPAKTWQVEDLDPQSGGSAYGRIGRILTSTGEIGTDHAFRESGDYVVRARAFGQQAGSEPVRMEFRIGGKAEKTIDVLAVEDTPETYEIRLKVDAGKTRIAVAFLNDYYNPDDPDTSRRDRNLVVDWLEVQGPIDVAPLAVPESHSRIIFREPANGDTRECTRAIVERFAGRAFRRPATIGEIARLVALAESATKEGETFERGIQVAVAAALVSPQFLFRVEIGRDPRNGTIAQPLTDFEIASRLSYFLWSSMPDDQLFRLAREGRLQEEITLEAQARRMLADPKARALVENFAGQWLHTRNLKTVSPAKDQFPNFDDALRQAMQRETELFFEAIVKDDRNILEFLDADFTFVNERLAKHYGLPDVTGEGFRRVSLSGDQRGGLLGQASILTVTSNPTRTSPVKRGRWILDQLLGTPPPPPPPDVPELSDDKDAIVKGTLRERMEQHRANPNCAACHSRMDPLGFGLENYDAIGAWRDRDGNFPVDATGTLPSGKSFRGPKELKGILKGKEREFTRCMTEKLLIYALGRGLGPGDACTVDRVVGALANDGRRFSRLVVEIVKSTPFRQRNGQGDES